MDNKIYVLVGYASGHIYVRGDKNLCLRMIQKMYPSTNFNIAVKSKVRPFKPEKRMLPEPMYLSEVTDD